MTDPSMPFSNQTTPTSIPWATSLPRDESNRTYGAVRGAWEIGEDLGQFFANAGSIPMNFVAQPVMERVKADYPYNGSVGGVQAFGQQTLGMKARSSDQGDEVVSIRCYEDAAEDIPACNAKVTWPEGASVFKGCQNSLDTSGCGK